MVDESDVMDETDVTGETGEAADIYMDVTTLPANVKMYKGETFKNVANGDDGQGGNQILKALADGWSLQRPEAK